MLRTIDRVYVPIFFLSALLLLGGTGGIVVPSAAAQKVTVSTSGQYSRGDYIFTESTDVFAWTTDLSFTQGRI